MGKRSRDATKTDFSSFMCIILMLTGCLVTILISNVVVIASNPENVQIASVISDGVEGEQEDAPTIINGNLIKNPWYVEVQRDHMVIYPGATVVNIKDLEFKENQFEQLVARVEEKKTNQYIVLLIRPYASSIARQLKKIIVDRGVDVGIDLLEKDLPLKFDNPSTNLNAGAAKKA